MGWSFARGASKADLINELTATWQQDGVTARCLASSVRGNVLWSVREIAYADGRTERVIACDLLASQRGYGWGYKGMQESWGPCYYTCPLSYLEMAPEASPEWRAKVRAHHDLTARRLAVELAIGETVKLDGVTIPYVTVTGLPKGKGPFAGLYGGRTYRVPRRYIAVDPETAIALQTMP